MCILHKNIYAQNMFIYAKQRIEKMFKKPIDFFEKKRTIKTPNIDKIINERETKNE